VRSVSTTALGIADSAIATFREAAAKRVAAGDGSRVAEEGMTQSICARAASLVDEARLVLYRNFEEMMTLCRAGAEIPIERRVGFRYESATAVVKCVEAVDLLFTASGGRAIFEGSPILRSFLDVHAARAHYANNPDKPGRNYGAVQLGLPNQDYFL
jgi:3-hydroxy-9,10-secoandrosta-1,3,5(10)-triene-9,17-dione monooxygenase